MTFLPLTQWIINNISQSSAKSFRRMESVLYTIPKVTKVSISRSLKLFKLVDNTSWDSSIHQIYKPCVQQTRGGTIWKKGSAEELYNLKYNFSQSKTLPLATLRFWWLNLLLNRKCLGIFTNIFLNIWKFDMIFFDKLLKNAEDRFFKKWICAVST